MVTRRTMGEHIVLRNVEKELPVAVEGNHNVGLAHRLFVNDHLKQLIRINAPFNTTAYDYRLITRLNEAQGIGPCTVAVYVHCRCSLIHVTKPELERLDAVRTHKSFLFEKTKAKNVVAEKRRFLIDRRQSVGGGKNCIDVHSGGRGRGTHGDSNQRTVLAIAQERYCS